MTFVQLEFLGFFAIVFLVYWGVRTTRLRNLVLIVSSSVFYGWVHPWFLILLYSSAACDFLAVLAMERWPSRRKTFLALSVSGNLGLLGYFKYFDFFVENVARLLEVLGLHHGLDLLGIYLPVGISFYTFQTMSYSIDVYRGRLEPRRDPIAYLAFVSSFPQLVAGPVERASSLLVQMERDRRFDLGAIRSGLTLALWGGVKKVCIADTIAPYVDKVFALDHPSRTLAMAGAVAFALQILADFSGYTDIARGTARMLGLHLRENFLHPYLASSPGDFWRRWHVSFSSWIRDYLYISLGGSRGRFWFVTRNTFLSMTLSGLWHGASWNFVLWGLYHATILVVYRLVTPLVPAGLTRMRPARALAVAWMFVLTCAGWFIFRDHSLAHIVRVAFSSPPGDAAAQTVIAGMLVILTVILSLPLLLAFGVEKTMKERIEASPWLLPVQTTLWAMFAVAIFFFARDGASDFIYFRF